MDADKYEKPTHCGHEWIHKRGMNFELKKCSKCGVFEPDDEPTPEEKCKKHQWFFHWDEGYASCINCGIKEHEETDRERYRSQVEGHEKQECEDPNQPVMNQPMSSPSPEARVDWEKEADRIVAGGWTDAGDYGDITDENWTCLKLDITKALSAAFEKGRETRCWNRCLFSEMNQAAYEAGEKKGRDGK